MKCMITKTVKTAAGQHDASRRPQTTQDGNHIALRMRNRNRKTRDLFKKVGVTSHDKTTRDRRVPEGHSAVYCSSPPGREDSNVFTLTIAISHCASHAASSYITRTYSTGSSHSPNVCHCQLTLHTNVFHWQFTFTECIPLSAHAHRMIWSSA